MILSLGITIHKIPMTMWNKFLISIVGSPTNDLPDSRIFLASSASGDSTRIRTRSQIQTYTIAAIRNFFRQNIKAAFLFEIKDGVSPSWGILSHDGQEKPRYKALRLLNLLEGTELFVDGEGTFVSALASTQNNVTRAILTNYDERNTNSELVPVTFLNLPSGIYSMTTEYLDGKTLPVRNISIQGGKLQRQVIMPPNMVVGIELKKE